MAKYVLAKTEDIPEGQHLVVEVAGRSIGVFNVGGEFYGLLNRCPHQGGPLCEGRLVGLLEADAPGQLHYHPDQKLLACPWHGWEFDVKTGQSYFDPARMRLRSYAIEVEAGSTVAAELAEEGVTRTRMADGEAKIGVMDASGSRLVEGPYTAHTVEVSVEDDYLVVIMRD